MHNCMPLYRCKPVLATARAIWGGSRRAPRLGHCWLFTVSVQLQPPGTARIDSHKQAASAKLQDVPRRLELFAEDHNVRPGSITVGSSLSACNLSPQVWLCLPRQIARCRMPVQSNQPPRQILSSCSLRWDLLMAAAAALPKAAVLTDGQGH